jgi:capsular polysaccharide biosynthesis protein
MKMRGTDVRAALKSARWVLVALVLVGALGGLLLDLRLDRSPVSSTAELSVSDASGAPANSDSGQTMTSYIENQMSTYAALATSDNVLEPAASGSGTTVAALKREVTATSTEDSTTLTLVVRAASPDAATAEADAVVKSLTGAITQLETPAGQPPRVVVTTSTPPTTPAARFVPPMGTLAAAGAVLGALVVLLGAMAWATGLPQRGWRWFSAWLFRQPSEAELARIPAADPNERRDDPEQALLKEARRWLAKVRHRD